MKSLAILWTALLQTVRQWKWETFTLPGLSSTTLKGVKLEIGQLNNNMKELILSQDYESPEISMCKKLVAEGDSVLELGSAIGFVSLFCLKCMSAKNVYCVEANLETIELLKKNYLANGYRPQVLHGAVAAIDGKIRLNAGADFWADSIIQEKGSDTCDGGILVPGFSFNSLLSNIPFKPNVLIVDVEGAELFIPWHNLPTEVVKIIVELHPHIVGHQAFIDIMNNLFNSGFVPLFGMGTVFAFQRTVFRDFLRKHYG